MRTKQFNPLFNSYLIYIGVAIASGGVALYTPIIVSETGQHFSGFWAASILFGLNLGRVLGSLAGTRMSTFANHPLTVTANIFLEGVALYCMAYLQQAWALALFALLAGLGSGMSFPGLKNYLLRIREIDQTALFSRLAFAIRIGLVGGYLTASWVPHDALKIVFLIVLITFIVYGVFMLIAMREIVRHEANGNGHAVPDERSDQAFRQEYAAATAKNDIRLPFMFYLSNAIFWCFAVQPMIGFSLHIPKYTPEIPVSTPFWLAALVIIFFQIPVSRRAVRTREHFRFLQYGYASLFLSFAIMVFFGNHASAVVAAAILLSFGQVFYGPSLDVLTARFADKAAADTGKLMSQQMLYQSMGNMVGSLAGGMLFDLAQYLHLPVLNWLLLAAAALWMTLLSRKKIPDWYQAGSAPANAG